MYCICVRVRVCVYGCGCVCPGHMVKHTPNNTNLLTIIITFLPLPLMIPSAVVVHVLKHIDFNNTVYLSFLSICNLHSFLIFCFTIFFFSLLIGKLRMRINVRASAYTRRKAKYHFHFLPASSTKPKSGSQFKSYVCITNLINIFFFLLSSLLSSLASKDHNNILIANFTFSFYSERYINYIWFGLSIKKSVF